jgi:hypothetical protein
VSDQINKLEQTKPVKVNIPSLSFPRFDANDSTLSHLTTSEKDKLRKELALAYLHTALETEGRMSLPFSGPNFWYDQKAKKISLWN